MSEAAAGSTLLTTGIPAAPPAVAGNPAPVDGAQAAIQGALDAPPEWAPPKFWDAEKQTVRHEDLGKAYQNLEKLLGREKVPVPTADDDEEGWQRWYAASGRPEDPDKYEFKRPELPADMPYDDELEKSFKTFAHVNGLNKKQAAALYEGYAKVQMERHGHYTTHQKQAVAQAETALRREYGNQYEQAVGQAKSALAQYADPEYLQFLEQSGQGNDPRVIRAWIKVGKEMSGDTKLKGNVQPTAQPADLDNAITNFRSQHNEALHTKDHPRHDWAVKEYNKLFEARFGA